MIRLDDDDSNDVLRLPLLFLFPTLMFIYLGNEAKRLNNIPMKLKD